MALKDGKEVVFSQDHDVERHSDEKHDGRRKSSIANVLHGGDTNAIEGQIFSMNSIDPALDAKMRLVNQVGATTRRARITLTLTGNQPNRLDKFPHQALLPDRVWIHGRQSDPRYSVRNRWPSCSRVQAIIPEWLNLRFICWYVDRSSFLGKYYFVLMLENSKLI